MPHVSYTRNLGRNRSLRKATVRSLAQALIKNERITTTLARAKEAQRLTEKLITLGKDPSLASRRRAISLLDDPVLVARLFSTVAPRFAKRAGGYTRILHAGVRNGDGASIAVVELVELSPDLQAPRTKKEKKAAKEAPAAAPPPAKAQPPKEVPPPRELRKPKDSAPAAPQKEAKPEKKPKGFLDGLRKLFKRKDRPEK